MLHRLENLNIDLYNGECRILLENNNNKLFYREQNCTNYSAEGPAHKKNCILFKLRIIKDVFSSSNTIPYVIQYEILHSTSLHSRRKVVAISGKKLLISGVSYVHSTTQHRFYHERPAK